MCSQKDSFLAALGLPRDLDDEECARSVSDLVSLAATEKRSDGVKLQDIVDAVENYQCAEYLVSIPQFVFLSTTWNFDNKPLSAIPRLRLGKKTALQLARPIIRDTVSLVSSSAHDTTNAEGRELLKEIAGFVKALYPWASASASGNDLEEMKTLLRGLLDSTVVGCVSTIQASLAAREFESLFPRLVVKSYVKDGWADGENAMAQIQAALGVLNPSLPTEKLEIKSTSGLIYLAHTKPTAQSLISAFPQLYPLLLSSLQGNIALDEALFVLLRLLARNHLRIASYAIPPDIAGPLCAVLSAIASTHLEPFIRHLNLHLISMVLSTIHPPLRLEIILGLTKSEEFPQIRGPAVGFLKEAVLEALSSPAHPVEPNPFASPMLFRAFGPVLFKTNPPDFLTFRHTRDDLARSLELLRIADCLSFYYVLLLRDQENRTTVRDMDNITNVGKFFLRPLRQFLDHHIHIIVEGEPLMSLLSLQICLERIENALTAVKGGSVATDRDDRVPDD
ncbi:hypothetical protein ID866_4094 [Astraeus odoratus]|nr:hypothetical protein ID866_4094 [Astraeus odoratus]